MRRWLRNRILAVGLAGLLALTVTAPPASAADLGMPTKAPVYKAPEAAPVEFDWLPLAVLLLIGLGVGLCVEFCEQHGGPPPITPSTAGGNHQHDELTDISVENRTVGALA
jgi:hypothetical protein